MKCQGGSGEDAPLSLGLGRQQEQEHMNSGSKDPMCEEGIIFLYVRVNFTKQLYFHLTKLDCIVQSHELTITYPAVCMNQLLFVDDTVVVADSESQLVTEFGRVCERRKLRVNVGKSTVMRCTRNEDGARLNVMLNGEVLEEVG